MNESLGDRIKGYESVTHFTATKRMPLMIRVDGRAFHTYTRGMEKPFDKKLMDAMVKAAAEVAAGMQGFKVAYIQSDEVTFCITDYDKLETQGWFDYDLSKIISISASHMTAAFNRRIDKEATAQFDSRAFNIPHTDVVNAFLWRAKDWERNSLQMYCRAHFSHKELHGKGKQEMHEMLYGIGKNWAKDLTPRDKNGTYLIQSGQRIYIDSLIYPNYYDLNKSIGYLFDYPD